MGLYDEFVDGEQVEQVKCFDDTMHQFLRGDKVPTLERHTNYAIKCGDKWEFIVVRDCVFMGIFKKPFVYPIFDKWGEKIYLDESPLSEEAKRMIREMRAESDFTHRKV